MPSKQVFKVTLRDVTAVCVHFARYRIEQGEADDGAIFLSIISEDGEARFGISRWPAGFPNAGRYYAFNKNGRIVANAPTMSDLLTKRALAVEPSRKVSQVSVPISLTD